MDNSAEGVARLEAFCRAHGVELVAMEATGGLERLAFRLLSAAGVGCAVLNPRAVRRFAEAMGYLEKTDRIDAGVIAWYAHTKGVTAQQPPGEAQDRLQALVTRLGQLTALKVSQQNQRRLVCDEAALASIDELLRLLAGQIRAFELQIAELLKTDPLWREFNTAFRQIKGVADRTVARILAEMPEIGLLDAKQVAKLAGLAPLANDSGKHHGRRSVRGGRAGVRAILYVIAGVAARFDPDFQIVHKRLSDAGKPRKVIRIAIARKILVRLNAKARDLRRQLPAHA